MTRKVAPLPRDFEVDRVSSWRKMRERDEEDSRARRLSPTEWAFYRIVTVYSRSIYRRG